MPLTKVSAGVIAANAVQDSVGSQSITGDKLGLTAINANNIVGGAVTGDKIGATSINANNIVNASITASQLATSLNLATNNVQVSSIQSATGTPAITFAANGQMTLANTPLQLTGGQIKFPATHIPSADGNTLDDYEEGTWTPTLTVGTCDNAGCVYTKIGRFVTVSGFLHNFSDRSSASTVQIEGLPFPYANIGNGVSFGKTAMYRYINSDFTMYMSPTSSALTWYISGSGAYGTLKYSDLNNSAIEVYFSFAYMTS